MISLINNYMTNIYIISINKLKHIMDKLCIKHGKDSLLVKQD